MKIQIMSLFLNEELIHRIMFSPPYSCGVCSYIALRKMAAEIGGEIKITDFDEKLRYRFC